MVECLHIAHVFERASEFDLIHNSFDFLPLSYSGLVATPVVTTIHGFSSPRILPVYQRYDASSAYVAISDSDRHPSLDYLATIHHGIDTDTFSLHPSPGGYLLFFGRIHPDKGTAEAIDIALESGIPLVIAGIVQDQPYFDGRVAPRVDGKRVSFVGPVSTAERSALLGGAHALLHPIAFDEPFGYSVVESMACGTPVIAFRRGSMGELIEDGTTGYLVDDVEGAVAAVARAASLDRAAIRVRAVARFGVARMVDEYLRVYAEVVGTAALGRCGEHGREQILELRRREADRRVGGSVVQPDLAAAFVVDEPAGEDDVRDVPIRARTPRAARRSTPGADAAGGSARRGRGVRARPCRCSPRRFP